MSSAETPDLDKKKENTTTPTTNLKNIGNFLLLLAYFILGIVVYFSFSGLVLYACKLAQSNILPTDINCAPYTTQDPAIKEILIKYKNAACYHSIFQIKILIKNLFKLEKMRSGFFCSYRTSDKN